MPRDLHAKLRHREPKSAERGAETLNLQVAHNPCLSLRQATRNGTFSSIMAQGLPDRRDLMVMKREKPTLFQTEERRSSLDQ